MTQDDQIWIAQLQRDLEAAAAKLQQLALGEKGLFYLVVSQAQFNVASAARFTGYILDELKKQEKETEK